MARSLTAQIFSRFAQSVSSKITGRFSGDLDMNAADFLPAIGDKYLHSEAGGVWVVQNVMSVRTSGSPLVSLISEKHPDLKKILSVSALADPEEYRKHH